MYIYLYKYSCYYLHTLRGWVAFCVQGLSVLFWYSIFVSVRVQKRCSRLVAQCSCTDMVQCSGVVVWCSSLVQWLFGAVQPSGAEVLHWQWCNDPLLPTHHCTHVCCTLYTVQGCIVGRQLFWKRLFISQNCGWCFLLCFWMYHSEFHYDSSTPSYPELWLKL